jgi:hypothetical protein
MKRFDVHDMRRNNRKADQHVYMHFHDASRQEAFTDAA